MVSTAHATSTMAMAPTATTCSISTTTDLLTVRWNHGRLVVVVSTAHLVVMVTSTTSHRSSIVASMVMEAATASTRREGRPTTASSIATSTLVIALILWLGLLDINSATIDLGNWIVLDKVLSDRLVSEGHKAEATGRTSVDVLENDGVVHLAELHEVLLELLAGQLEVEATNEDFALRVGELD